MVFGEKAYQVFYHPRNPAPGEFGTRVAVVAATSRNEASYKF